MPLGVHFYFNGDLRGRLQQSAVFYWSETTQPLLKSAVVVKVKYVYIFLLPYNQCGRKKHSNSK